MNTKGYIILASLLMLLLASCDTLQRDLTASRMRQQYNESLQEQKLQRFRSNVNTSLQAASGRLTMTLYDNLGKGGEAYHTFKTNNIQYNYQEGTAMVKLTVYWARRKNKEVSISGYLKYHTDGRVSFLCTDAQGIRSSDRSYVSKLTNGVYI